MMTILTKQTLEFQSNGLTAEINMPLAQFMAHFGVPDREYQADLISCEYHAIGLTIDDSGSGAIQRFWFRIRANRFSAKFSAMDFVTDTGITTHVTQKQL